MFCTDLGSPEGFYGRYTQVFISLIPFLFPTIKSVVCHIVRLLYVILSDDYTRRDVHCRRFSVRSWMDAEDGRGWTQTDADGRGVDMRELRSDVSSP